MGKILELRKKTKNGLELIVSSPVDGEGSAILETVKVIMKNSQHLLTTAEEFNDTAEQEDEMIRSHLEHPDKVIIVPRIEGQIVGMMNFGWALEKGILIKVNLVCQFIRTSAAWVLEK